MHHLVETPNHNHVQMFRCTEHVRDQRETRKRPIVVPSQVSTRQGLKICLVQARPCLHSDRFVGS